MKWFQWNIQSIETNQSIENRNETNMVYALTKIGCDQSSHSVKNSVKSFKDFQTILKRNGWTNAAESNWEIKLEHNNCENGKNTIGLWLTWFLFDISSFIIHAFQIAQWNELFHTFQWKKNQ